MLDASSLAHDARTPDAPTARRVPRTYGLLIETGQWADCDAVFARLVVREDGAPYPCNPRSDGESMIWDAPRRFNGLLLYNLHLRAYVSAYGAGEFFTHISIQYDNLNCVALKTAEQAAKTLRLIERRRESLRAQEAGDMMMALGAALGLSFYAAKRPNEDGVPPRQSGQFYSDDAWLFLPLADARDAFRAKLAAIQERLIAEK